MFIASIVSLALILLTENVACKSPFPKTIKNLVTFGDSYTDPIHTGDRATAWPIYAGGYGNLTVYDFALSGATCSNNLTFRPVGSVLESQVPTFEQMLQNKNISLDPLETVLTLWIGTNDVGDGELITGGQVGNASIVETTACAIQWLKELYKKGFRNFIYQNMLPLNLTPLYSRDSYPNIFWDLERNTTEWNIFMTELVRAGNEIAALMLAALPPSLPDAHIGLFSSYNLFTDMYNNPSLYLNGTDPLNVTFPSQACVLSIGGATSNCTTILGAAADSYLWVDELHPGEQADRIVAREIVKAINGSSVQWTTWFT